MEERTASGNTSGYESSSEEYYSDSDSAWESDSSSESAWEEDDLETMDTMPPAAEVGEPETQTPRITQTSEHVVIQVRSHSRLLSHTHEHSSQYVSVCMYVYLSRCVAMV